MKKLGRVGALLRRLPTGPVRGAEIGVFRGQMSMQLLLARRDLFLFMVDSWAPSYAQAASYSATRDYHAHLSPEQQRTHRTYALSSTQFAADRITVLHMWSAGAAAQIPDCSLDFVFIDADHSYAGTAADIAAWLPKLKDGGLLGGHDYCYGYGPDKQYDFNVIDAVDDAVARHAWTLELDVDSCWFVRP